MSTATIHPNRMLLRFCRPHRLLLSLVVGLSAVAVSGTSIAQGNPTDLTVVEPTPKDISQAAQYFDEGRDAFRKERFSEAAEAFEKADGLAPNPKVLLLAIQSRELGDDLAHAATLAALAEQRHPNDPLFTELTTLLRKADASLSRLTVTCDAPCQVMVGNRLIHGPPATRRYVYLAKGEYRIRAAWSEGQSLAKRYEAEAKQRGELHFVSKSDGPASAVGDEPSAAPKPSSSSSDGWDSGSERQDDDEWGDDEWGDDEWGDEPQAFDDPPDDPMAGNASASEDRASSGMAPWVFWTGATGTVILAGVSIWSGIDTLNNPGKQKVVQECAGLGESCALYQQGLRSQDRTNILWGVTAGVGLLTTLIGTLWTDWDDSGAAPQAAGSLRIRPVLSIGGMTDTGSAVGAARINAPYLGAVGRF